MEELWKHHGAAHQVAAPSLAPAPAPGNAGGSGNAANHQQQQQHPFIAQEVCVTIRQETLGTAANHLINFGGLDGGGGGGVAKHHSGHHQATNNQLLALVQQQQQQQHHLHHHHSLHPFNSLQHHLLPPSASSSSSSSSSSSLATLPWPAVQELHPAAARSLVAAENSSLLEQRDFRNRSRTTLPDKRSNVDFFKDNSFSRSVYESSSNTTTPNQYFPPPESRSQHQQQQQQQPPQQRKSSFSSATLRVYTPGAHGFVANGELILSEKARMDIVCLCHSYLWTVAKFVQHAGNHTASPGSAVYLENGETLLQWRRNVFTRAGISVPDDEAGWDWCDGSEASRSLHASKVPETLTSCQPVQVANLPASMSYGNYQDAIFQPVTRSSRGADLLPFPSQFQRIVGPAKPMHFDFINGGRTYSSAEQQREKIVHADQVRKPWDETVRQDKDNFASSFELRLGQPSQQAQKAGTSFGTVYRSQFQATEIDQPGSLIYERAYQKIDATLHQGQVNAYGFQAQQDVHHHQFTQQQRLEKINVLNIGQFGPTSLERTVLSERTKFWTEPPNQDAATTTRLNQNPNQNGGRVAAEHGDTFCQLKSQVPESSVQIVSQSQVKQRMVLLSGDVVGLPPMENQQQYVQAGQDYSQAGWSNSLPMEARYLHGKEREVGHSFGNDGSRAAPQEIVACRVSSNISFGQQHQQEQDGDHKGTGPVLDGQEAIHQAGEQHREQQQAAETQVTNPPSANSRGSPAVQHKSTSEDPYVVDEANRNSAALLTSRQNTEERNSQSLLDQRHEDTSSMVPATSGLLVPVGDNRGDNSELPTGEVHPQKNSSIENGSFGWSTPLKNCNDLELPVDGRDEDGVVAGKSISAEDGDETSEVSTKSSENAVSGFSDAREDNDDETSTLESESQEPDLVDEGSGTGKFGSEKLETTDTRELSASPSHRSSSEANDSVMIEGLQETAEDEDQGQEQQQHRDAKVGKRGRKKLMSLNKTIMARNSEASKASENEAGVAETPATAKRSQRHEEKQTDFRKLATTHKRTRTALRKTRSATLKDKEDDEEAPVKPKSNTLVKIKVRKREIPNPGEQDSDTDCRTKHNRTGNGGNGGKMMSLKSIMKHSAERRITHLEGASRAKSPSRDAQEQACMEEDGGGAPRKEIRKRKLSELNSPIPDAPANRPFRVGQSVIPRAERSPRKAKPPADDHDSQKHHLPAPPKKRLDAGQAGKSSAAETNSNTAKRRRSSTIHQQPSSSFSGVDEPQVTQTVKVKSVENELDLKKQCKRAQPCKQNACSVCGSSKSESHNQLIYCSSCPVKVHQACYGVPKVPKSSWSCRPCKSEVENIVCVLCGYSGGAMTRAQNAQAVVKELLKAWKAGSTERPKTGLKQVRRSVRNSLKEVEEIRNTITESVGDPNVTQWVHMVCALWMPGTRCLNLGTMGMFDVGGVSVSRRRLSCSICKREGGSCIQCHEAKCAIPFHAWCAHSKGLLQIETVNDSDGHVRFHGKCFDHSTEIEMKRSKLCDDKHASDPSKRPARKSSLQRI